MNKQNYLTITIIILVIIFALIIILFPKQTAAEEEAKCIGENSVLYVQLGCHACENQKAIFGENYKHLNVIDCWYQKEECSEIESIPTWEINGKRLTGFKKIKELKELTGC